MRFSLATVLAVLAVTSEVVSGAIVSNRRAMPVHARLARRMVRQKRCIQRNPLQTSTPSTSAAPAPTTTTTSSQVQSPAPTDNGNNNNNNNNNDNNGNYGTIQSFGSPCDPPGATSECGIPDPPRFLPTPALNGNANVTCPSF
jgi:hypothetical protein